MRLILVGNRSERQRLREALDGARFDIVAEYESFAEARRADISADAILAPGVRRAAAVDEDGTETDSAYPERLTLRELDVLELLGEGLSNKSIADRLGISDQTVKFHVSSLCGKLGAANRTDAIRRAVRRGLLTL